MNGFYGLLSIGTIIVVLITYLLHKFCRKKSFVKYIPAILLVAADCGFLIKSEYFSTGFEDLAYLVMAMIAGILFIPSLLAAIILGIVNRNKNK